ncbi:MAG: glycoside hydrolase family 9 protein [Ruminococcus sp.]|jgi:hypothetical protein|nr:glycoside hydrolase family 9 protein [Ruminococcus sp.]
MKFKKILSTLTATVVLGSMAAMPTSAAEKSAYVDYASALQASLYLYDANYCGEDVGEKSGLTWRDDCHTYDKEILVDGVPTDLSGGFHDAGDHVKFGLPAAYSAFTLGLAYKQFPNSFDSTKQTAHLETITDHFAEYFRKCIIYNEDGTVKTFVYQVGTGTPDHNYWGSPEDQPQDSGRVDAYTTNEKNICADILGATISALAINYDNFGNEADLKAAQDLYAYLDTFREVIVNDTSDDTDDLEVVSKVPEYVRWEDATNQNSPFDYISLAAATMKVADPANTATYDSLDNPANAMGINEIYKGYYPCNWDGVHGFYNLMAGNLSAVTGNVLDNLGVGQEYTTNFHSTQKWGNARLNASLQFLGLIADKVGGGTTTYGEWARGQMDYLFGDNPQNQAYVVGYDYNPDVKYVKYPHHRASDGGTTSPGAWNENWYDTNADGTWTPKAGINIVQTEQKYVLIGALSGGPEDASGLFIDSTNNYIGNEVAIDYQAGFVGALAGLFEVYQNDGTASIVEPPSNLAEGVSNKYALNPTPDPTPTPDPAGPDDPSVIPDTPAVTTGTSKSGAKQTGTSGPAAIIITGLLCAGAAYALRRKQD